MKKSVAFLLLSVLAASCQTEEPERQGVVVTIRPTRMDEENYSKELSYNEGGQLTRLTQRTAFANGTEWVSTQDFVYSSDGTLLESTTDTGWRIVYQVKDKKVVRTDEIINGTPSQWHTYQYDGKSRLVETTTWQHWPEEGGDIRVARDTYEYDGRGNLITHQLYYFGPRGEEMFPLTTILYSDYDDKLNSEDYFDFQPFNPQVRFRVNNPGMMVVKNAKGIVAVTETYSYMYDVQRGFATSKKTQVVLPSGQAEPYSTRYTFAEN